MFTNHFESDMWAEALPLMMETYVLAKTAESVVWE